MKPSEQLKQLDLKQMESFVAVVDEGDFTSAARRLGLSQSTVSRRIQDLEQALGAELMARDAHMVVLTPSGRRLLPEARTVIATIQRCRLAVNERLAITSFRIGCNSLVAGFLTELAGRLRKLMPASALELVSLAPAEAITALENSRIDLAFIGCPMSRMRSDFRQRVIRRCQIGIVAARSHPVFTDTLIPWAALNGQPVVLPCRSRFPIKRKAIDACLKESKIRPAKVFDAPDASSAFVSVSGGYAVAVLPEYAAASRPPGIEFAKLTDPVRYMDLAALWHRDNDGPQLERILAECGQEF